MKKFYDEFWQIPKEVMANTKLTLQSRVIYGILYTRMNGDNKSWPGHKSIAKDFGIGERSVSRYLKELLDAGLIEITRRGLGRSNVYSLPIPAKLADQDLPPVANQEPPIVANPSMKRTERKEQTIAASAAGAFNFEEYLKEMRFKNPQRHINIIGDYWDFKDFKLPSAKACSDEIARWVKIAKQLCEYDEIRINEVMDWLWNNADYKWTLESVLKTINDDLAKLKTKGRKKIN